MHQKPGFAKNKYALAGLLVIFLYLLPFIALGENAPALVHDTFESTFVWYKVLSESGQLFGPIDATIPQIMNGLPRNSLPGELNFVTISFYLLPPYPAFVLNICIMHIIAFFGMYLLLKKHFLKEEKHEAIVAGTSLAFALLPFWPPGCLTVAGLPLALYAFLNIRAKIASKKDWLIIAALPLFSSFTYSFAFFLFGIFLLLLYDLWKEKKLNILLLAAIVLMSLIFFAIEYRLVYGMFLSESFVSHRIEFASYPTDFIRVLGRSARTFIFGQYHAASLHYFALAAAGIASVLILFKKSKQEGKAKPSGIFSNALSALSAEPKAALLAEQAVFPGLLRQQKALLVKLLLLIAAICVFSEAIAGWDALEPLREQFSILTTFSFKRFIFLLPLLWYIAFAISLVLISEKMKYGKHIALALLVLQVCLLFSYTDELIQAGGLGELLSAEPSFAGIYSESLFNEIKDFIGREQQDYRIVSIGLPANIPQYSGFYTLDSYQNNYPLPYKHSFRKIIGKELEKIPPLKEYFDGWGNRCYVFAAELEGKYFFTKESGKKISNLELNTAALEEMGGEYVFSAVEIENAGDNGLALLRVFERNDSLWKIWLYRVQ